MRISDWSSDVCSSDLLEALFIRLEMAVEQVGAKRIVLDTIESLFSAFSNPAILRAEIRRLFDWRSEEHTSELQSLMRISYAVFCLPKKLKKQSEIKLYRKSKISTPHKDFIHIQY